MAGSAQIGNLQVRLGIDTAQFSAGVKQVQSQLGALGTGLKAFAAGAAGALSLTAITASLKSAANRMDDLGKAAQRIGIPVEELSKLEYAAKLADVSLEQLSTAVGKFSKGLAEMQSTGKGSVAEALKALNIAAVDSQGKLRPTSEIIGDLAERFAVMRDGAGKTAIAMALFGKSGAEMIPLLNGGREAIAGAAEELAQFGGVVDEKAAVAAEEFNDNLTRLETAADSLAQQVTTALLPTLIELTDQFVLLVKEVPVQEWISDVTDWFKQLGPFIETTRKEVEMLTGAFKALGWTSSGSGQGLSPDWGKVWGENPQTVADGKQSLPSARRTQEAPTLPDLGSSKKQPRWMDPGYKSQSPSQEGDLAVQASYLTQQFEDAQASAEDLAGSITDTLGYAIGGLVDGTMSFKDAWADMAQSLTETLADFTQQLLRSGLLQLLAKFGTSFGGSMGLGGFGGFYASGGYLGAGKWGIAGENGPEVVEGPAKISPMGAGGGTTVNIFNQSGAQVEQRKRQDNQGRDVLDVYVRSKASDQAAKDSKRLLGNGFGLSPALARR